MFGHYTLPPDNGKALFDTTKWVVTTKSASGKQMWQTAQGTWSYSKAHAATFMAQEADDLISTLKPTDGSRAATPTKEPAA
jgi:hypothetical protein